MVLPHQLDTIVLLVGMLGDSYVSAQEHSQPTAVKDTADVGAKHWVYVAISYLADECCDTIAQHWCPEMG